MKTSYILFILLLATLAGCGSSKNTFYWGEYASTLYDLKKEPSEKTLEAHKKMLLLVMEESDNKKRKVPPGVFAEYGYILLRSGEEAGGMEYLDKEVALYPESTVFIHRLKSEYSRRKQ